MKVAQLHTGDVLEFPDMTPDDAIDATVRNHLKVHANNEAKKKKEQPPAEDKSQAESLNAHRENTQALMQHSEQLHNRDLQAHQQMGQIRDMKHDAQHQQLMMAQSGNNQLIQRMNELLTANTQVQMQVKQSLDELAQIVSTAVDTVTKIMKSPKDLVFDARGRPTGVRHKEEQQEQLTGGEANGDV